MVLILVLALLQAPADLPAFLAQLEKDRAAGVAADALLKRIDEWSKDRPAGIQARLAWNRAFLEATRKTDSLRAEWLNRNLGQKVTLGKISGSVREVKTDRAVLETASGIVEVLFSSLPFEDLLKENPLPPKSFEEPILRLTTGRTEAALALARAVEPPSLQSRVLTAFVGWELQSADRGLAEGKVLKVAEELAATWTRHVDLMEAGMGALHAFVETEFLPRLFQESERLLPKERKGARKLLDLVPALTKSRDTLEALPKRIWTTVEPGQWNAVPLADFATEAVKAVGTKLVLEDKANGDETSTFEINALPVPWKEISGFRAKIKPGSVAFVDFRVGFGSPARYHIAALETKTPMAFYQFVAARGERSRYDDFKKIARRPEFDFRLEGAKDEWRIFVDPLPLKVVKEDRDPSQILFMTHNGRAELLSLEVRKR